MTLNKSFFFISHSINFKLNIAFYVSYLGWEPLDQYPEGQYDMLPASVTAQEQASAD